MIRPAKPKDVPHIVNLAVESLETFSPLPLKIDRDTIKDVVEQGLNPANFLWVSEIEGDVVAAVGASATRGWYKGLTCAVELHYSRVPGEWVKLMLELSRWIKSRSGIKYASIFLEPEHNGNEKMIRFLKRIGFETQSVGLHYARV